MDTQMQHQVETGCFILNRGILKLQALTPELVTTIELHTIWAFPRFDGGFAFCECLETGILYFEAGE